MHRVLIAEDEVDLADALAEGLRTQGYHVETVYDGASALAHAESFAVDLIVLDRDLPLLSGDAVCRALVALGTRAGIVMVTAADGPGQKISGLDLGADDYITKPFDYAELLARMRAVLRRDEGRGAGVEWHDLLLNPGARTVTRAGRSVDLAPKEFDCLQVLLRADGAVVTFSELVDRVWPPDGETSRGAVKAVVHSLRHKLGHPDPIETQHGAGYKLRAP